MLRLNNLSFSYGDDLVIDNVSLEINNNEIVAIIGKSGCGKTTLLNNCANIYGKKTEIMLNDEILDSNKQKIGLLMQDLGLLPWLNVRANCLLPYVIKKQDITPEVEAHFQMILQKLKIEELVDNHINKLSGGQKQRVSLARLFTFNPDLILLDEAFSSLDIFSKEEAIKLFFALWQANQVPTILVTHSIDEALFMAHKIVVVEKGCKILKVIDNPLFMNDKYHQAVEYGSLYQDIAALIKGEWL